PEIVIVLGIPTRDQRVGDRHPCLRKEPGTIRYGQPVRRSDAADVPVDLNAVICHIEPADRCLLVRTKRAIQSTQCFYFIEVFSPLGTVEVWRSISSKLRRTVERQGLHLCDPRTQWRDGRRW